MRPDALRGIVERLQAEGYKVVAHPEGGDLPPFAAGFRPDLIATRGGEGVIVEVKTNRIDLAGDPDVIRLAEVVDSQPGWRFDVVVLEPGSPVEELLQGADEPSDDQLAELLNTAEAMADEGHLPSACVIAWAGLEASMRRLRDEAESYGRTTPNELMSTLYSNGFLSREQFDRLRESFKIRSQVVHGLIPPTIDPATVRFVTATARSLARDGEAALSAH